MRSGIMTAGLAGLALAGTVSANELIVTGVVDGPLTGGVPKAIEVYVAADIADLSIYGLGSANNGGGSDGEEFTFPAVAAAAGDFIYVASETDAFTAFFGFGPDYTSGAALINGDDAVEIFKDGAVIDTFGEIDVDGSGQPWEYTDGWAYRVDGTGPDGMAFPIGNWSFSGPDALDGEVDNDSAATPFPIGTYMPGGFVDCNDNGVPDDEDIAMGTSLDCNLDGVPDECQLADNDCNENMIPDDCDIAEGTSMDVNGNGIPDECEMPTVDGLVITEIMNNPSAVSDALGEWFEITNVSDVAIDLMGLTVRDDGSDSFTVDVSVIVMPGDHVVFGNNADMATNGGVEVDYEYGGQMALANGDDEIEIVDVDGITVLDRVAYDGGPMFPDPNGASMNLDPDATDAVSNDDGANWCEAVTPYGDGDLGTPGAMNDFCEPMIVDCNDNGIPDDEDIAMGTSQDCNDNGVPDECDIADGTSEDCNENMIPDECDIAEGTSMDENGNGIPDECEMPTTAGLVITEIMNNPDAVSDADGEWFEITNVGDAPIDLMGLTIRDEGSDSFLVDASVIVMPGDYVVLGNNADMATNGGVEVDFEYGGQMFLANGDDEIVIVDVDGVTVVDAVAYDGGPTFPDPTGASMSLDPASTDPVSNDDGANWCEAVSPYGDGDLGTPGSMNDACDVVVDCPEDFDGDGMVGTTDLLQLLAAWGPCAGCVEDLDGDGMVGTTDLLQLLAAWGACPVG